MRNTVRNILALTFFGVACAACAGQVSGVDIDLTGTDARAAEVDASATVVDASVTMTDGASTIVDAPGSPVMAPSDPCSGLASIGTGLGTTWKRATSPTAVTWGNLETKTDIDPTSYVAIWNVNYPTSNNPWPGNSGLTTQVKVSKSYYLAEGFTVPTDGSVARVNWPFAGVGVNSNYAMSISVCPGDFGQTGTQITAHCSIHFSQSSSGLTAFVGGTGGCVLAPGQKYYLNILPCADLPSGDVAVQNIDPNYPIRPWIGRF